MLDQVSMLGGGKKGERKGIKRTSKLWFLPSRNLMEERDMLRSL